MRKRWTNELLDLMRLVGDPWLDDEFGRVIRPHGEREWLEANATRFDRNGLDPLPEEAMAVTLPADWSTEDEDADHYWRTAYDYKAELDRDDVDLAQKMFIGHGSEVGAALLLASLPHSYAVESGASLLIQTDRLESKADRRILRTSEFLLSVMVEHGVRDAKLVRELQTNVYPVDPRLGLLPGGAGYLAARRTRLLHSIIRGSFGRGDELWNLVEGRPAGQIIHQEFLIGTILSFSVTVWEALERLGIRWSARERSAYLATWDWVAQLMGIGVPAVAEAILELDPDRCKELGLPDRAGRERLLKPFTDGHLRPTTPDEAEEVMTLIRDRNWPAEEERGPFQNASGKQLVSTLLDELEEAMPSYLQSLPLATMRYLADRRVTVALGLGGGGLPPLALNWVQGQARGWNLTRANPMVAPGMRVAANLISLHAFTHFIESGKFEFPGIIGQRAVLRRNRPRKAVRQDRPGRDRQDVA